MPKGLQNNAKSMRVLIVKTQAIGDVLMALHMIESLKKRHPGANITWVCGSQVVPILSRVDDIDTIVSVDEHVLFKGSFIARVWEVLLLWKKLLSFVGFDKVIIGHSDWKYKLIYPFQMRSTVSFGRKQHKRLPLGTRYHGSDYCALSTSEEFIWRNGISFPKINFDNLDKFKWQDKTVVLFPGGAKNVLSEQSLRRWPVEYYAELSNLLANDGYHVILSGSESDLWISSYFSDQVRNLIGQTTIEETIALINSAGAVVTHDSGPMHMSLLLSKTKTLSIFGPVLDSSRVPRGLEHSQIVSNCDRLPECSPCYNGRGFPACENNKCMRVCKPKEVKAMVDKVFRAC